MDAGVGHDDDDADEGHFEYPFEVTFELLQLRTEASFLT